MIKLCPGSVQYLSPRNMALVQTGHVWAFPNSETCRTLAIKPRTMEAKTRPKVNAALMKGVNPRLLCRKMGCVWSSTDPSAAMGVYGPHDKLNR